MGNPFAPLSYKLPPATPRAPVHPPMGRLRRLGLKREEEAEVYEDWRAMTDAERFESLEALSHIGDDELREQIREGREERQLIARSEAAQARSRLDAGVVFEGNRIGVADDGVPTPREHVTGADADAAAVDPEDVPDESVPDVLEWVGDDRARAAAALIAEQRRHDPPRKTLQAPLEAIIG